MSLRNATGRSGQAPSIVDFYNPSVNGKDAHGRTREQILKWKDDKLERSHDYIQMLFPLPEGSMFSYTAPIIDKKTMEEFRSNGHLQITLGHAFTRMVEFYGFEVVTTLDSEVPAYQAEEDVAAAARQKQAVEGRGKGKATELEEHAEDRNDGAASTAPLDADSSVTSPRDTELLEKSVASSSAHGLRLIRGPNFEERSKNWCVPMDHNHLRISRILRSLRVLGLQRQCEAFYEALTHVYNDPKITIGKSSMMFWTRAVREPLHIAPDGTECKWLKTL